MASQAIASQVMASQAMASIASTGGHPRGELVDVSSPPRQSAWGGTEEPGASLQDTPV